MKQLLLKKACVAIVTISVILTGCLNQNEIPFERMKKIGENHYSYQRHLLPAIFSKCQEQGYSVVTENLDSDSGVTTYILKLNNKSFKITEEIDPNLLAKNNYPPTVEQAKKNREDAAKAAKFLNKNNERLQKLVDETSAPSVDELIIGGGPSGVMAHSTGVRGLPPGVLCNQGMQIPRVVVVDPSPGLWPVAAGKFPHAGQPVTEWQSRGFTRQPGEFNEDHKDLGRPDDIANALIMTAYETGMVRYNGYAVEPPQGKREDLDLWEHSERKVRIKIASANYPKGRFFYANRITLTVGIGPSRALSPKQLPEEVEREINAMNSTAIVYGADHVLSAITGGRVLVSGGGATSGVNVYVAWKKGSEVVWIGRASEPRPGRDDEYVRPLADLRKELEQENITSERKAQINTEIQNILGFRKAKDAANTKEIFAASDITKRLGEILQIKKGDPQNPNEKGKLMVEIDKGKWEAFDQIVVSHGDVPSVVGGKGLPGSIDLAAGLEYKMIMQNNRVVGLSNTASSQSFIPENSIRILGSSMSLYMTSYIAKSQQKEYEKLIIAQANADTVPANSKGITGGIHQIGIDVPLANNYMVEQKSKD